MTTPLPPLVSADRLASELGSADLLVLDATLFLPEHGRDARAEFEAAHVPGARFMDLKRFQPLPEPERLRAMLGELGAGEGVRTVVYDNSPLRSAARGWWLLWHAGFQASVLDGGLKRWLSTNPSWDGEGDHATQAHGGGGSGLSAATVDAGGPSEPPPSRDARHLPVPGRISKEQVLASGVPVVDARSGPRFRGEEPEPRPGVAPGHIPGSRNLHYGALLHADGTMKAPAELRTTFAEAGVDPSRPMIATCGSGVTASSIVFAAHLLGNDDVRLYDGSWAEWGADPLAPKATGPA